MHYSDEREKELEVMTFDKDEFSKFWFDTQDSLLKEFVKYCKGHELMVGCSSQLKDIDYLVKSFSKELTEKRTKHPN